MFLFLLLKDSSFDHYNNDAFFLFLPQKDFYFCLETFFTFFLLQFFVLLFEDFLCFFDNIYLPFLYIYKKNIKKNLIVIYHFYIYTQKNL